VLTAAAPADKTRLTMAAAQAWQAGAIADIGRTEPPLWPARPEHPLILPPNRMPRRGLGGTAGRISLLHALAHIELNAIDLAWDIIARFAKPSLPRAFFDDWVAVARDEAEHFLGLEALLAGLGSHYGALPAHEGLWDAARKTAGSLKERLAVVPMTLEARALDTAPATIAKLRATTDEGTRAVLEEVVEDEIAHVAVGVRWFDRLCRRDGEDPAAAYQAIIRGHFPKGLKAPFNHDARARARFPRDYYEPLAG
jgi:uncharacterized ferritin-like protein (DUF455 family)